MEGVAKFDFRANQEDEISFRANEILKILQLDEVRENYFHRTANLREFRTEIGTEPNSTDKLDMFPKTEST